MESLAQPLREPVADSQLARKKWPDSVAPPAVQCGAFEEVVRGCNELICRRRPAGRPSPVLQLSQPEAASLLDVYSHEVQTAHTAGRPWQGEQSVEMVRGGGGVYLV